MSTRTNKTKTIAAALSLAWLGCAAPNSQRVCRPALSWAAPAFACEGAALAAPEPVAEPAVAPEPEPEPDRLALADTIQFEIDSATLLPESERLLDEIARVLELHPELEQVQIEGHTDDTASDDYNLELSRRRAAAVRQYLIERGIAEERLVAEGYGESRPVADNTTEEGRLRNRRVEFRILKRAGR